MKKITQSNLFLSTKMSHQSFLKKIAKSQKFDKNFRSFSDSSPKMTRLPDSSETYVPITYPEKKKTSYYTRTSHLPNWAHKSTNYRPHCNIVNKNHVRTSHRRTGKIHFVKQPVSRVFYFPSLNVSVISCVAIISCTADVE